MASRPPSVIKSKKRQQTSCWTCSQTPDKTAARPSSLQTPSNALMHSDGDTEDARGAAPPSADIRVLGYRDDTCIWAALVRPEYDGAAHSRPADLGRRGGLSLLDVRYHRCGDSICTGYSLLPSGRQVLVWWA